MLRASRHHPRGGALISLLMGVLILMILMGLYMRAPVPGAAGGGAVPFPQVQTNKARAAALSMNTATVNTSYAAWRAGQPGRVGAEEVAGFVQRQSMGGSAGAWYVDGERVQNVVTLETPTFAESMGFAD